MLSPAKGKALLTKAVLPVLSLLLFFIIASNTKARQKQPDRPIAVAGIDTVVTSDTNIITVGALVPSADGRSTQVIFNESEQVFTLSRADQSFAALNRSLEEALKSATPLKAITNPERGSIVALLQLSGRELELFRSLRKDMLTGEKARKIDVSKIDSTKFNIVDDYLKWPAFRLCTKVVPDYATAKKIFDYCASQCCCIVGPHQVNPCIPFQYVIDGCFARAHKMRWIIEKHFGYCSEKVFSFATEGNHKLVVKADKWGGCCVEWWYHVVPLIRVQSRFGALTRPQAYVIDPGMFDKPVLLSTWLQAQENLGCKPYAHVDAYSIQPSSAYTPTYPGGSPYATDPNYTLTDAKLIEYAGKHTCN